MADIRHLLLHISQEASTDEKGQFFEDFVADILRPMRLKVVQRLRVTGMEIDILAKGEDRPQTILIECKAHRDPLAADVITKLIGNVQIRHADEGWLFSTSDLSKDGRGLWEEIQADTKNSRGFTWYSPSKTIDVLISQKQVVDPTVLLHMLKGYDIGDWSLVVTPGKRSWLVEILNDGLPASLAVFDARSGTGLNTRDAKEVSTASPRYGALKPIDLSTAAVPQAGAIAVRAPVARVIPGDVWEDPRPARPVDFVGREDVLGQIATFVEQVRNGATETRSFAVLAPSGWGKSSLALKLDKLASNGTLPSCSVTAVDSRSATSASFVAEALRVALQDAMQSVPLTKRGAIRIRSLREPLESPEIGRLFEELRQKERVAVLLFDQFEELFAKEALFEVFNAVRDLSLDLDAKQLPLVLGFAWKTDVSLPQQHPAYHLWHQLGDRRRTFRIAEFGRGEVLRVVSKAERAIGKRLSRALRSRLAEQCQGLPWLLKKLLVHVLQRVSTPESQYLLLERELDVEQLFKEDLEQLQDEHLRCLKFVAARAPVPVAEVEESFTHDTANFLINKHLLVRSGMNYVVYWDIFRDYLVEEKVPEIPWARTFQRMAPGAMRALPLLKTDGPMSALALSERLALKEGPTFNLLGDLLALQLVDSDGIGTYRIARHLTDLSPSHVADAVHSQLRRHVVARAIERSMPKGQLLDAESWISFFREQQPRSRGFSTATLRQYAANLKSWLVFAGLLEYRTGKIARPDGRGAQMGVVAAGKMIDGIFLGTSSPGRMEQLLGQLCASPSPSPRVDLEREGLRNAIADAVSLGLVASDAGKVRLLLTASTKAECVILAKEVVSKQESVVLASQCFDEQKGDRRAASMKFAERLGANWKPTSASRNLGGLVQYARWVIAEPSE